MSTVQQKDWSDALLVANATKRQNQSIKNELKAVPRAEGYLRAADLIATLEDRDPQPSLTLEAFFAAIHRVGKSGSRRLCKRLLIAPNKRLRDLSSRQAREVCALMHAEAVAARNKKTTVALKRAA